MLSGSIYKQKLFRELFVVSRAFELLSAAIANKQLCGLTYKH